MHTKSEPVHIYGFVIGYTRRSIKLYFQFFFFKIHVLIIKIMGVEDVRNLKSAKSRKICLVFGENNVKHKIHIK